jgi:hypothetical protein
VERREARDTQGRGEGVLTSLSFHSSLEQDRPHISCQQGKTSKHTSACIDGTMDSSSAPFKSPRPPAPRRARSNSLSKQSSRQSLRDDFNNAASVEPVPPVPAQHASVGLGVSSLNLSSKNNNNTIASAAESMFGSEDSSRSTTYPTGIPKKPETATTTMLTGNANSSAAVLAKLEGLLIAKSNEIQLAGRLGEALLTQQAELETRIRELEDEVRRNDDHASVFGNGTRETRAAAQYGAENNDDDSDTESNAILDERVKSKLQELESEMLRWEKGNEQIYKEVGVPSGTGPELVRQASSASMVGFFLTASTLSRGQSNGLADLNTSYSGQANLLHLFPSQARKMASTALVLQKQMKATVLHYHHPHHGDSEMPNIEQTISNLQLKLVNPFSLKCDDYKLF